MRETHIFAVNFYSSLTKNNTIIDIIKISNKNQNNYEFYQNNG
jgi:hypothetical protein